MFPVIIDILYTLFYVIFLQKHLTDLQDKGVTYSVGLDSGFYMLKIFDSLSSDSVVGNKIIEIS